MYLKEISATGFKSFADKLTISLDGKTTCIVGPNGSGKSTIAQGFREYAESVVPKTVELNPTAGAAIIKMSSGMKSGKIF